MALDPSIILQAGRGVTPLKDPSEIADEQATRQLRQLQVQSAQQGVQDDQAYRQALQSGATGQDLVTRLQSAGLGKQAQAAQAFQTDQQKAQGERGKLVAEGMKNGAGQILANPTEDNAIQTLTMAQQQYGLPQQMVDGAKAQIYAARNDPNKLKQLAVGWGGDAEKVLGKFTSQNLGGTQQVQRINPATGQLEIAAEQARTQSPDSVASVGQSAANAALTDARARDANVLRAQGNAAGRIPSGYRPSADGQTLEFIPGGPADPNTKPAGGKPLNDTQSKALQFGSRMQEANSTFDELASGENPVDRPGALKRAADTVPNLAGGAALSSLANYTQSAGQQRVEQAQRDFVNAVLRRESGAAISASEFDSAAKQYFPSANDTPEVIAQKKRNREIATRGILAEVPDAQDRIAQVRGISPQSSPTAPKGPQPKQKSINIGGQDMMAELAPDGKYYVQRNGKWNEVR